MTFLMWNRPMTEIPASLIAFQRRFPDDDACARWLVAVRWPNGFRCPACGHDRRRELKTRKHSFECTRCHRQTSVTAGTLPHRTRLSLGTGSCRSATRACRRGRGAAPKARCRSPAAGHDPTLQRQGSRQLRCAQRRRDRDRQDRRLVRLSLQSAPKSPRCLPVPVPAGSAC